MKTITIFALLLFAVMQGAFAQRTITGKVINAEDGLSMPGVYVAVKGSTTVTATDANGNFTLSVPNDATIVVSFIGFKTVEIPVVNQTLFDITLQTDATVLGDVVVSADRVIPPERAVVTAMGIVRDKMTLTTSIQSVSRDELVMTGESNFMMALNGRVPGVQVYSDGTSTTMETFRGIKSFVLGAQKPPLFVIDGVQVIVRQISTGNGAGEFIYNLDEILAMLNAEDIEDITIHKGSQALYGSAGANGVIIITTKKR